MLVGKRFLSDCKPSAFYGCLDAGGYHVGQRAFIVDSDAGVLDAERIENLTRLSLNRISIIRSDTGFKRKLEAPGIAWLNRDVQVGADFLAPVSGFGDRGCGHKRSSPLMKRRTQKNKTLLRPSAYVWNRRYKPYFNFARIASVICTVLAAPWLMDFGPPEMRIMS